MYKKIIPSLIFLLILSIGNISCTCECESNETKQASEKAEYKNYPKGNFFEIPNSSNTHLLLLQKEDGKSEILNETRFFVFSKVDDEVILEDFIPMGKVEWISNTEIRVEKYPGNITKETQSASGYIFNITTKEKEELTNQ